jgi:putative endonuclease
MVNMYYAYVIINPKGLLYKGSTDNFFKRLQEHNSGQYTSWTRHKGPWKLYYLEEFSTRKDALVRERFFKSKTGWQFLKQLNNSSILPE